MSTYYDGKDLETMTTGCFHEHYKETFGQFVTTVTATLKNPSPRGNWVRTICAPVTANRVGLAQPTNATTPRRKKWRLTRKARKDEDPIRPGRRPSPILTWQSKSICPGPRSTVPAIYAALPGRRGKAIRTARR